MLNEEKEKKAEELIKSGKIVLYDIDRDEDLRWAVGDLWSWEKHMNTNLNKISKVLRLDPNSEYHKDIEELAANILNGVRIERTKHLKRLTKLKEYGLWCAYKHAIGGMMQFGEVAAKDVYIALTKLEKIKKMVKEGKPKEEIEKLRKEVKEAWNNARKGFETSAFCHDAIIRMDAFADKWKDKKDLNEKDK